MFSADYFGSSGHGAIRKWNLVNLSDSSITIVNCISHYLQIFFLLSFLVRQKDVCLSPGHVSFQMRLIVLMMCSLRSEQRVLEAVLAVHLLLCVYQQKKQRIYFYAENAVFLNAGSV
jgi:uncharacterized membrane protein